MGLVLLTIFRQFYPLSPLPNFPIAFVIALVGSLGMSWLGATLGDYFAEGNKQVEAAAAGSRLPLVWLGVAAGIVAFVIFFVTTATPPV
jgi:hypothetical protein